MKTEIKRSYRWGYLLSEQELRRIIQSAQEHMSKLGVASYRQLLSVKLRDGALIESNNPDEILSLENDGSKAVEGLKLLFDDEKDSPDNLIEIIFQNGIKNLKGWVSITLTITGQSRDWAFLAASDIEERVKKTKVAAPITLVNNPLLHVLPLLIGLFVIMPIMMKRTIASDTPANLLEIAYKKGEVQNPIEALIFLEKARNSQATPFSMTWIMLVSIGLPMIIVLALYLILPRMYPSYNFYWGDYMTLYDRRKGRVKIFWTVIVLGILASVVAGLILRLF